MTRRGLFVAFEGVEGSGKTTQVAMLAAWLRAAGQSAVVAREPGSTPLGERIRDTVLGAHLEVPARSELFLMLAARAAFVEQVVRPACDAGDVVIADRFELSTLAYQGAGRGLPLDEIQAANRFATSGLSPDATVLLELDPEEGARRQQAGGKVPDRIERAGSEFHRRVAAGYSKLAERVDKILRIDARGSQQVVHERVLSALAARYPETFALQGVIMPETPPEAV